MAIAIICGIAGLIILLIYIVPVLNGSYFNNVKVINYNVCIKKGMPVI